MDCSFALKTCATTQSGCSQILNPVDEKFTETLFGKFVDTFPQYFVQKFGSVERRASQFNTTSCPYT